MHNIYQNYPKLSILAQKAKKYQYMLVRLPKPTASGRPVMRIFSEILFSLGPIFEHKKQ